MKILAIVTGAILLFLFICGIWFMGNYNSLVTARNSTDKSWASVETQYQRRFDLIDNLVEVVKSAQKQEQDVFVKIAEARTAYNSAKSTDDKVAAANSIETNVALIPRLQEAYPDLKSNQQVTALMNDLLGTEDGILKARDGFNTTATNYNTNIQRFPKNVFASIFGFKARTLFKADTGADKAVKVKF
jgi:LemA protein